MPDLPWYVFALGAAFVVAVSAVIEKKTLEKEDALHYSSATIVLGGLLSLPFLFFVEWSSLSWGELLFLYVIATLTSVSFFLVARSMKALEAGEVSTLLALTPATVAIAAFIIFGEALTSLQVLGLGLVVIGLLILEFPYLIALLKKTKDRVHVFYVGCALLAVGVYTASSLLDRVALTTFSVSSLSFIVITQTMCMANMLLLGFVLRRHGQASLSALRTSPRKVLIVASLLFVSRVLHAQAISLAFVALASGLKRVGAIFTILLSGAFLHESGLLRKLLAASLVVSGAISLVL